MSTRTVEAGEMYGFRIVNIFPDKCSEEEWADFADTMSAMLKKAEERKCGSDIYKAIRRPEG